MVAVADTIQNEHDPSSGTFSSSNRSLLNELVAKYGISDPTQNPTSQNSPAEADYRYVAGTMFWVRAEPLAAFFKKYAPLDIRRTLEKGNVMDENRGSNAHAWERMLSWLIFAQNFNIKGL
ncbi:hypothetical protein ACQ86N_40385 [Puia sp. P3]|uniref:hypothetical protein n=1 Tax=Puia sp. P3 TaxID=3423952 RepID=UPI003D676747